MVNKYKEFIKKNILINGFNNYKIDINTGDKKYDKINVLCIDERLEKKQIFFEYIIKKDEHNILHCLSNDNVFLSKNNEREVEKEEYNFQDIVKFFHYHEWNIISEKSIENYIKQTIGCVNDFFEILNKEYYYTYIIKNDKLKFLSKGKINNKEQTYNEIINNILYNDKNYILINNRINNEEICKNGSNNSYKQYILDEKKKNPKFKTINCKYKDNLCNKHKYNRCIFKHSDHPIENS